MCTLLDIVNDARQGSWGRIGDRFRRNVPERGDGPGIVSFTGGEPLLRPDLVGALGALCQGVGTRVHLLTGLYFARGGRIPGPISKALESVDHVSVSLDAFHEREVPRSQALQAVETILSTGKNVSFQIVGLDDFDPYLDDVVNEIRFRFGDRVPMLVSAVKAIGRARELPLPERRSGSLAQPNAHLMHLMDPCSMAAWPVLCSDGRISACCNQDVVDGLEVDHLRLGHAAVDTWPQIRRRIVSDPLLCGIRAFGPRVLAQQLGTATDGGYCNTCHNLSHVPNLKTAADDRIRVAFLKACPANHESTF